MRQHVTGVASTPHRTHARARSGTLPNPTASTTKHHTTRWVTAGAVGALQVRPRSVGAGAAHSAILTTGDPAACECGLKPVCAVPLTGHPSPCPVRCTLRPPASPACPGICPGRASCSVGRSWPPGFCPPRRGSRTRRAPGCRPPPAASASCVRRQQREDRGPRCVELTSCIPHHTDMFGI